MPTLKVDGVELYYEDTRKGADVVCFSHGLLWSTAMWSPQIAALRGRYRCIAWDHAGQGRSEVPPMRCIDMETLTEQALAFLDAMQVERCHFVGLSMGGFVGMRLAARHPDRIRSLSLLATAPDPEPVANRRKYRLLVAILKVLGAKPLKGVVMPVMFGRTFLEDPMRRSERREWEKRLVGNPRSIWRAVNGVIEREGVLEEIGNIRCPTLVLHGDEDAAILRRRAWLAHQGIAGSKFVAIPRAGHTPTVEEPEAVSEALGAFLEGVR